MAEMQAEPVNQKEASQGKTAVVVAQMEDRVKQGKPKTEYRTDVIGGREYGWWRWTQNRWGSHALDGCYLPAS